MTKLFLIAALMTLSLSALATGGPAGTAANGSAQAQAAAAADDDVADPDAGNNCALNGDQSLRGPPGNRGGNGENGGTRTGQGTGR
jgi:hypothetical protein